MTFANKEVSTLFSLSSRFNLSLCYTWIVFVARGRTNTSTVSFSARRTRTSGDKGGGGVGRRVNEFLSSKLDPVCIQSLLLCTGLDLHSILIHSFIHPSYSRRHSNNSTPNLQKQTQVSDFILVIQTSKEDC